MRSTKQTLNASLKKQVYALFDQVFADIKTPEEAHLVFSDLLKPHEYESLVKRLTTCYYLSKGRSYNNIKTNLKVSSTTIASIQPLIATKGIKHAIKLMSAEEWAEKWSSKFKKLTKDKRK